MEGFRPFGIPMLDTQRAVLLFEEYEALRLADYQRLGHEEAAVQMRVSRPTFTRIYEKARRTLAAALVEGRVLVIEGGNYQTEGYWYRCEGCCRLLRSSKTKAGCQFCRSSALRRLDSASCGKKCKGRCACERPRGRSAAAPGKRRPENPGPSLETGMADPHCCHHQTELNNKTDP